jgi:O-antigen/teichoic acid export membrane protein
MSLPATTNPRAEPIGRSPLHVVARNAVVTLAGQVLLKLFAFAFSVYVVRRLGADDFGRYAAALAYVAVFSVLTDLGTSSLAMREMARDKRTAAWMAPDIRALRLVLSAAAVLLIPLSAWWLGKPASMVLAIFVASCGLLLYALYGPMSSMLVASERLDALSGIGLLNQLVFMVAGTIALLVGAGYVGLLAASLAGVAAMVLVATRVARRVLDVRFERPDPRRWRALLASSFPFGVKLTATALSNRFDTVFLSFALTDAAVGWYNVPYSLVATLLLSAQSLSTSMYPSLIREYAVAADSFAGTVERAVRYMLMLSLPMAIGGTVLADRIIPVLYGEQFVPAVAVMRIMVWALPLLFLAELLGRTINAMHLERPAAWLTALSVPISMGLIIVFVGQYGVTGAAIAMVCTRLLTVVLSALVVGPRDLVRGGLGPLLRVAAAALVMGAVVWLVRDSAAVAALDGRVALPALIAAGVITYGTAVLLFGAISRAEARFAYDGLRRRVTQLGWRR